MTSKLWQITKGDAAHLPYENGQVDLVFGSPSYEDCRDCLEHGEDVGVSRNTEDWVAWMVEVTKEALRVCDGPVCWVIEGKTKNFSYSGGPLLLAADLIRAGICLRKPAIYERVGIPGSGGPDWLKNNWELILCCTRGGKLPWADPLACANPCIYGPGGEIGHRMRDGTRVNKRKFPGHASRGSSEGDVMTKKQYTPPKLANPGNVVQETYTAEQVQEMLDQYGKADVVHCTVGGGLLGSQLAHSNEAPFPIKLPKFFISSFCRPEGLVVDPFSGSGSTGQAVLECGGDRRYHGIDLRQSQVVLGTRRMIETEQKLGTTKCECGAIDDLKLIDIRGCNAYGDREIRRKMCCKECRKRIRGLCRVVL